MDNSSNLTVILPQSSAALALASDVALVGHLVMLLSALSRHSVNGSLESHYSWYTFLLKVTGLLHLAYFTALSRDSSWLRCMSESSCFSLCSILISDCIISSSSAWRGSLEASVAGGLCASSSTSDIRNVDRLRTGKTATV